MSVLSILGVILLAVSVLALLSCLAILFQHEPLDWSFSISVSAVVLYLAVVVLWAFGIPFPQF